MRQIPLGLMNVQDTQDKNLKFACQQYTAWSDCTDTQLAWLYAGSKG